LETHVLASNLTGPRYRGTFNRSVLQKLSGT